MRIPLKFSDSLNYGLCNFKNFQNTTCSHKSRNALAFIRFPILMSKKREWYRPNEGNDPPTRFTNSFVYNSNFKSTHSFHSSSPFTGTNKPNKLTCCQLCGFIAQLVEYCTGHRRDHRFESRWSHINFFRCV